MTSVREGDLRRHHQPVSVLDHDVAQIRQLCALVSPLGVHPRIRIGRALVRVVLPFFAAEIDMPIATASTPTMVVVRSVLLLEALVARPRLEHRAVHAEVLVRSQARISGLRDRLLQESTADVSGQQPFPVLAETARVPHRVVHLQAHEPALWRM